MTDQHITKEQARELLDGTTEGPWRIDVGEDSYGFDQEYLDVDLEDEDNLVLAAAAPDLAATVIDQAARIERFRRLIGAMYSGPAFENLCAIHLRPGDLGEDA